MGKSVKERGIIRLHDSDDFYEADLWMWNMTLSGLSDMFLHEVTHLDLIIIKTLQLIQVKILRDESLSMLILQVETGLDEMVMSGVHNLTGWLGWPDTTIGDGDPRPMAATVTKVRIEVSLVLDAELDTCLDNLDDMDILSSQLSFDTVSFRLDQELLMSGIVDTALQVTVLY